MHRTLAALALACALLTPAMAASDGTEPDPVLTPGSVETQDLDIICHHKTGERRHATPAEKRGVYVAYGLANRRDGYCAAGGGCVLDDRIPLEVGGSNDTRNLWPQVKTGAFNQELKNVCENAAHKALCAGQIGVEAAQDIFRGDWTVGCAPYRVKARRRHTSEPETAR